MPRALPARNRPPLGDCAALRYGPEKAGKMSKLIREFFPRGLGVGHVGLALLTLAAVSACTRYQPEPLSPEAAYAALDTRTLDDPRLQRLIGDLLPERAASEPWDLSSLTL